MKINRTLKCLREKNAIFLEIFNFLNLELREDPTNTPREIFDLMQSFSLYNYLLIQNKIVDSVRSKN